MIGVVENMSWFTGDDGTRYELFGAGGGEELAERARRPAARRGSRSCPRSARAATSAARSSPRPRRRGRRRCSATLAERIDTELAPKRIYNPQLKIN